jgi:hypothetical protein
MQVYEVTWRVIDGEQHYYPTAFVQAASIEQARDWAWEALAEFWGEETEVRDSGAWSWNDERVATVDLVDEAVRIHINTIDGGAVKGTLMVNGEKRG